MRTRFSISLPVLILAGFIYFITDTPSLLSLLLPAALHELGHIVTLRLLGLRISCFKAELKGLCIEYRGCTSAAGHVMAAAAGPLWGIVYGLAAAWLALRLDSGWLELSAGISLILSMFNLMPALPLDGGRILYNISEALWGPGFAARLLNALGLATGTVLLALGAWLMLKGFGIAVEMAAVWLLMYTGEKLRNPMYREII